MSHSTELNNTQNFFQSIAPMETKRIVIPKKPKNPDISYTQYHNTNPSLDDNEVDAILAARINKIDSASESSPIEPIIDCRLQQEILKSITSNNIPAFYAKVAPLMSSDSNLPLLRTVLPNAWKHGMLHETVYTDRGTTTLLGAAIFHGANEIVKYMLDIAPAIGNAYGVQIPPLHMAIIALNPNMVELLLTKGVKAEALDIYGRNAMKVIEDMMFPIMQLGKPCPEIWKIGDLIKHSLKPDQHLLAPPLENKSHTDTIPPLDWEMTTEFSTHPGQNIQLITTPLGEEYFETNL